MTKKNNHFKFSVGDLITYKYPQFPNTKMSAGWNEQDIRCPYLLIEKVVHNPETGFWYWKAVSALGAIEQLTSDPRKFKLVHPVARKTTEETKVEDQCVLAT